MLHPAHRALLSKLVPLLLALAPIAASAEVSDKAPSALHIWGFGIAASVACFLGGCWRRWFGIVLAILPGAWFISLFLEIHSADVGPHLRNEQGSAYFVQAFLA